MCSVIKQNTFEPAERPMRPNGQNMFSNFYRTCSLNKCVLLIIIIINVPAERPMRPNGDRTCSQTLTEHVLLTNVFCYTCTRRESKETQRLQNMFSSRICALSKCVLLYRTYVCARREGKEAQPLERGQGGATARSDMSTEHVLLTNVFCHTCTHALRKTVTKKFKNSVH